MLRLSFAVVIVSLVFIYTVKENTAAVDKIDDQSQNSATKPKSEIQEENVEKSDQSSSNKPNNQGSQLLQSITQLFVKPKIEPFEVVTYRQFSFTQMEYELPSELIKIYGEWRLASGLLYQTTTPLCPEYKTDDDADIKFLKDIRKEFPDFSRCLFVRNFEKDETRSCQREPQLVITNRKQDDGSPIICGISDHQQLIEAQYHNCGSEDDLRNYAFKVIKACQKKCKEIPPFEPRRYTMYQICYDFQHKKTLWTKHTPLTPALLANQESPYKNLSNEFRIEDFDDDTSSLDLNKSTFSSLKKAYQDTESSITTAFTMVPKEHMALPYWKKATTHIINSASLSTKFIPLMKAINNGILQASSNLFVKSKKNLQIYTKAETFVLEMSLMNFFASLPLVKSAISRFMPEASPNLFDSNIWYRFVYDESEKSGVLIVLHNTREQLPDQKECNGDERLRCDIKNWSNSPELVSDDILSHVYCCKISEERVKQLFSIKELKLEKSLNIQNILKPEHAEPLIGADVEKEVENDDQK